MLCRSKITQNNTNRPFSIYIYIYTMLILQRRFLKTRQFIQDFNILSIFTISVTDIAVTLIKLRKHTYYVTVKYRRHAVPD